jgi:threonine synthase
VSAAAPVASALSHLEGSASGDRLAADALAGLDPADGRPLLARYDFEQAARTLTAEALAARRTGGLWRWAELLPVRDPTCRLHLGEGSTPLLAAPRLGEAFGIPRLSVKAESLNPTGTFKARGMAVAVSRAAELGATGFVAPSAGNAAGALAAYGAAAGLPVTVVLPADVPEPNRVEALACGATVEQIDGLIDACGRRASEIATATGAFDLSTMKEPNRVEGKKTMGFELVEDLDWRLPDAIVYPTGGGTGLVGMWKGFDELEALGLIGRERPRMIAVQAEGCAPFVRAFERGDRTAEPWVGATTRAGGLRVPGGVGDRLVLDALRTSGGTAVAVSETALTEAQLLAGRLGAGYVGPETGAALAALGPLRERGDLRSSDEVVLFDCGSGHKAAPPPKLSL